MVKLYDNTVALGLGFLSAVYFALNTLFWCVLLYLVLLVKLIAPRAFGDRLSRAMIFVAEAWISSNSYGLDTFHHIDWHIEGGEGLSADRSYLVCANHQAWTDIVILQKVFNRRIPFLRFFIKQELVYVPLLGLAWKALDFPRMKRYSKAYLERHPEKRGEDLATTRATCARLRGKPISILNFLEGTRFTPTKRAAQQSPFAHLLRPKVGGLAFVIDAMGDQFDALIDVTIKYADGPVSLWGLLSGRLKRARVTVREVPIPKDLLGGDYQGDAAYRERMQAWVHALWREKDQRLAGA